MAGAETRAAGEDIAIIGMACVFPGADGPEAFWRNICAGEDQIGEPSAEWGAARYLNGIGPTRITTASGGYLGDLYRFDPAELGVMPSSVDGGEPDQFLALKAARDALADAGYLGGGHDHTNTGIVLGHSTYLHRGNASLVQHGVMADQMVSLFREILPDAPEPALARLRAALVDQLPPLNSDVTPGMVPNVMTGRIANRLDLRGPNYIIDAACASSLLAVHTAMEELRAGRSDLMLAGGVNASTPAEAYMVFTQLGALSRRSKVRPFDAESDGTLLGEGLGIVALKRLDDALAAGDRIYAVIKSVGQSSDGKGAGLLAPRLEGEVLAIRRAFAAALISPDTIGLLEAHGTGIPLGDRTEVQALREIFGDRPGGLPRAALGTVKSMIGHCIPAAGIAGLIKTALALYYRTLPPTLFDSVQPALGLENTPFYINTETRPWIQPRGTPRRAGINAFGFGGVNSHAILEEAPEGEESPRPVHLPAELVVCAAATPAALLAKLERLRAALSWPLADASLADIAAASIGRDGEAGPARVAIVATSPGDLADKLGKAAERLQAGRAEFQVRSGIYAAERARPGKLAFVFPGEGAQYQGMLGDVLIAFPEARRWFDFWESLYQGSEVRPSDCVFPPPTTVEQSVLDRLEGELFTVAMGSEATFIGSQALLAIMRRLGVVPDGLVGHSSGEHTALRAAGVLGREGWQELEASIGQLKQLYQNLEAAGEVTRGALLTVGAVPRERALALADGKDIHLALDNCRQQVVLFGPRQKLEELAATLGKEGGLCAFLPFDRPYHTPLFAPAAEMIERSYRDMSFLPPSVPIYSCATAAIMPSDPAEIRKLAAEQWRTCVRFTETIRQMHAEGFDTFVEVGPSANLSGFVDNILEGKDALVVPLDSRRRSSLVQLLHAIGRLWVSGRDMRLGAVMAGRAIPALDLDAPAPPRSRARVFANTLPFVTLPQAERDAIREALSLPPAATGPFEREPIARVAAVTSAPASAHSPTPLVATRVVGGTAVATAEPASDPGARAILDPSPSSPTRGNALSGHFALMRQFLDVQESVMTAAAGPFFTSEAIEDGGAAYPFLHRIVARDAGRLTAECDLDAAQEFVRQHVLYSMHVSDLDPKLTALPVVPMAVSLEMLVEAASALAGGLVPVRLENVRAHNWIAVDATRTVLLEAELLPDAGGEVRVAARIADSVGQALVEAEVVLFDEPLPPPAYAVPPLAARNAPVLRPEDLYTTGMFHGPIYHSVGRVEAWDETGIDVTLGDTPLDGFIGPGARPRCILNPVLLDAIGHVTAYWIVETIGIDFSCFPSRIERIELFDAAREDTAGSRVAGRLHFDEGGDGPRFLSGDFDCVGPEGRLLFRVSGWRDRFFDVPSRFYDARFRPRDGFFGDDASALFAALPAGALVWRVPAFPPGFLDDAGGIWRRVLERTMLSAEERLAFAALSGQQRRRDDWLIGRIALKEAARTWIERAHGVRLMPADLVLRVAEGGKPYIAGDELEHLGDMPDVSVAHAGGEAVAVAAPPGIAVGVDLERVGRIAAADLLAGGFSDAERTLVSGGAGDPETTALQAWCAKEAAAKCLGLGLNGRPTSFVVTEIDGCGNGRVAFGDTALAVLSAADGPSVLAVAFRSSVSA
jgi:acyl transferase domain-containing protein/phosphopantetheinyl transferase